MNHETEYDTDFNPERYATKMVLYDGLMIALIIGLAVLIAVL